MIEPVAADAALLADIRATADVMDEHVRLWWLGQSGFLVQWRGRHLLLDPYLSDSLTRKYAATEKPHIRMTRRVVDPASRTISRWLSMSRSRMLRRCAKGWSAGQKAMTRWRR